MKNASFLLSGMLWLATTAQAAQVITPSQTSLTVNSGATLNYSPLYSVTSPTTGAATGLGLRIHFNSQALQWQGTSQRFAYGLMPVGEVMSDSTDADNDATTDRYVVLAWVDTTAQWPGADALPLSLVQVQFTAVNGFSGTTQVRTTATATADDTAFTSTAMNITVNAATGTGVKVQVRGLLQGAYSSTNALMRDDLRTANLLPPTQPYSAWGYAGSETLSSTALAITGNNALVDWVLVELRSANASSTVVATQAAVLQRDGDVVDAATQSSDLSFPNLSAGNYYVVLRHRNHLGVMTQAPVSLSNTSARVDFAATATAVSGANPTATSSTQRLLWAGDVNADNKLISDGQNNDKNTILGTLLTQPDNTGAATNYQLTAYAVADVNLDGKVIYAGPNNEVNSLLGNVLLYPSNSSASTNYIIKGTLP